MNKLETAVISCFLVAPTSASAATLMVGAGQTYATPCAAFAAAKPGDEIDIAPATYHESCGVGVAGLTIKGVGGRPVIDMTGMTISNGKAIWTIDADNITVDGIELMGASVTDNNGAAFRIEMPSLTKFTIQNCYIHDNQDGILGAPTSPGGTVLIQNTEFSHNGTGPSCVGACTHNLYIGNNVGTLMFQYNWSHHLATDVAPNEKGHLLKSRAQNNFVLYNRITGEDDTSSYEVDLPNGGLGVIVGNSIEKHSNVGNSILLNYAEEGLTNSDKRIFVVNNTFVNDSMGNGPFINVANGGMLVAHDNLFVGAGAASSTGMLSSDNISSNAPMFANQAMFDYHLQMGSPAIGKGVAPGMADSFSLVPVNQYVHPLMETTRTDMGSAVGAFQYGSATASTGTGSSVAATSSGAGTSSSSSSMSTSSGAGGGSGQAKSSGGCTCSLSESSRGTSGALALTLAALGFSRRRRSRARDV